MHSSADLTLHEAHSAAGARFGERRGLPVVASYGDPAGEHAALSAGAGLVDLATRSLLEAAGPGPIRLKFLQGMLTNDVAGRAPGQGCRAAMLSPRGAVHALVRALVEKDVVVLETDADRVGPLQAELERYRVAAPVRFARRPSVVLALVGPDSAAVLARVGVASLPAGDEEHAPATVGGAAARLVRAGDLPGGGFVLHVPPEAVGAAWDALVAAGASPAGLDALDVRRVEALRPWWGDDIHEENLLHETGLVAECASFAKGCYVGQETMARLDARGGHVNKALRGLRLCLPAARGAAVRAEGKDVGHVTTAGVSPAFGPVALAWIHRNHFAPGTSVEVDGSPATVVTSFAEAARA